MHSACCQCKGCVGSPGSVTPTPSIPKSLSNLACPCHAMQLVMISKMLRLRLLDLDSLPDGKELFEALAEARQFWSLGDRHLLSYCQILHHIARCQHNYCQSKSFHILNLHFGVPNRLLYNTLVPFSSHLRRFGQGLWASLVQPAVSLRLLRLCSDTQPIDAQVAAAGSRPAKKRWFPNVSRSYWHCTCSTLLHTGPSTSHCKISY